MKNIRRSDEVKRKIFRTMHAATQAFIEKAKKQTTKLEKEMNACSNLHLKGAKELKYSKLTIAIEDAVVIEQALKNICEYSRDIDNNFLKEIEKNYHLYKAVQEVHKIFYELIDPLKIQPQGIISKRIKKNSDTANLIETYIVVLDKHIPGLKSGCAPANKTKFSRFHLLFKPPEEKNGYDDQNHPELISIANKFIAEAGKQLAKIEKELASAIKMKKDIIIKNKKFKQEALAKCINEAKKIIVECDHIIKEKKDYPNSARLWGEQESSAEKIAESWWTVNSSRASLQKLKHVGLISSHQSAPKPSKTSELITKFANDIQVNFRPVLRFNSDKDWEPINPNT